MLTGCASVRQSPFHYTIFYGFWYLYISTSSDFCYDIWHFQVIVIALGLMETLASFLLWETSPWVSQEGSNAVLAF